MTGAGICKGWRNSSKLTSDKKRMHIKSNAFSELARREKEIRGGHLDDVMRAALFMVFPLLGMLWRPDRGSSINTFPSRGIKPASKDLSKSPILALIDVQEVFNWRSKVMSLHPAEKVRFCGAFVTGDGEDQIVGD